MPLDEDIKRRLIDHGIDELLANHIAHLFIRDPLVIFSETVDQDDEVSADHFEVGRILLSVPNNAHLSP